MISVSEFILTIIAAIISLIVLSYLVQISWNYSLTPVLNFKNIDIVQACALIVLVSLLFKGMCLPKLLHSYKAMSYIETLASLFVTYALVSFFVTVSWNHCAPQLFGVREIDYFQGFAIYFLATTLLPFSDLWCLLSMNK